MSRACLTAMSLVVLFACRVNVPDLNEAVFACQDNVDCAGEFECINERCSNTNADPSRCKDTGCPLQSEACVKSEGGGTTCLPHCPSGGDCKMAATCVEAYGYEDRAEVHLAVCLECSPPCAPDFQCTPQSPMPDFFDNIATQCQPPPVECRNSGCPNPGDACARRPNDTTVCLPGCPNGDECSLSQACASAHCYDNSVQQDLPVCIECPGGCPDWARCQAEIAGPDYFENIPVDCGFAVVGCITNSCPTSPPGQECVKLRDNVSTTCLLGCPNYSECSASEACVEALGFQVGKSEQLALAVCAPCGAGCPPGQHCVADDPGTPRLFQMHNWQCVPD